MARILAALLVVLFTATSWLPVSAADLKLVIAFSEAAGELPEGIAVDRNGNLYVGMLGTGEIKRVPPSGRGATTYAKLPSPGQGFLAGITFDRAGNLYAAMASFDPETHGIWYVPAGGGTPRRWVALEPTTLPNWLEFWGDTLLVTDSVQGKVWAIDPAGNVSTWLDTPLLMGDVSLSPIPLPLGANGLVFWGNNAYIANTNFGRIVQVPVRSDGSAGTPRTFVEDASLAGTDGLAVDDRGNIYVTANFIDAIAMVSPNGTITTLASGDPLQNPASVVISRGNLYITNMALFAPEGARKPAILSMPVPSTPAGPADGGKGKGK